MDSGADDYKLPGQLAHLVGRRPVKTIRASKPIKGAVRVEVTSIYRRLPQPGKEPQPSVMMSVYTWDSEATVNRFNRGTERVLWARAWFEPDAQESMSLWIQAQRAIMTMTYSASTAVHVEGTAHGRK